LRVFVAKFRRRHHFIRARVKITIFHELAENAGLDKRTKFVY